jgi:capsular exopolysaccharide synthesis family protein
MSRVFEALRRSETDQGARALLGDIVVVPAAAEGYKAETLSTRTELELETAEPLPQAPRPDSRLVALLDPSSLGGEKFSLLALRLAYLQQQRGLRKIVITSTCPEDGKTLTATNLAFALGRQPRQKVLLVEGDIRKPAVVRMFGGKMFRGLTSYLQQDEKRITEFLYRHEKFPVWILPSGPIPDDPIEVLQSARMPELMGELGNWFTWIIIDSPPVNPLADTNLWARVADGILMVVREGKTSKRQLEQTVAALDKPNLIGTILNDSVTADHGHYNYYRYGYSSKTS